MKKINEKIVERTNKTLNTSRRRFLEGLAKYSIPNGLLRVSPLAAAFMGARFAEAQGTSDKKFVFIYHPNGKPKTLYEVNGAPSIDSQPLRPFKPHEGQIAALEMTISKPGQHGNLWLAAGAESYNPNDVHASSVNVQAAKVLGDLTPFRSIQLGVFSGDAGLAEPTSVGQSIPAGIDRLNGQPLAREWNSHRAIESIFSSTPSVPPTSSGGPSIYQKRLAAYDANMKILAELETKLGTDEKVKLDSHREAVKRLQDRATQAQIDFENMGDDGPDNAACGAPSVSAVGTSALVEYKAQADVAITALKCGLTNVCSIQFSETQASWRPNDGTADAVTSLNTGQDHHNGANHGNPASLPAVFEYMNKGAAYIIARLKEEGLFDDTVVCTFSEMGQGLDHTKDNGPITVASGISGFKSGVQRIDAGIDHYQIYGDIFKLLGLDSHIGGDKIYNYGSPGIVV